MSNKSNIKASMNETFAVVHAYVISRNATHRMEVVRTPIEGVKNRTGAQAYSSVTRHIKIAK
jgi:hypothetical protein